MVDTPKVSPSDEVVATLQELKARTPDYMGDAPKAKHYQRIHQAYDAAIKALSAQPSEPVGTWKYDYRLGPNIATTISDDPPALDLWVRNVSYTPPQPSLEVIERMARFACEWETAEISPDASLGGDGQNFRWMETRETLIKPLLTILTTPSTPPEPQHSLDVIETKAFKLLAALHDALVLSCEYTQGETVEEITKRVPAFKEASAFLLRSINHHYDEIEGTTPSTPPEPEEIEFNGCNDDGFMGKKPENLTTSGEGVIIMSDLKERLREMVPVGHYGPVLEEGLVCCNVIAEAADRIEALERALEQIANDGCMDPWSVARQALEQTP